MDGLSVGADLVSFIAGEAEEDAYYDFTRITLIIIKANNCIVSEEAEEKELLVMGAPTQVVVIIV